MTTAAAIALFLALVTKHFLCDFPLQAHPYLYGHKGEYGHPGGVAHAGIHMLGTAGAILAASAWMPPETQGWIAVVLSVADGFLHYHIDWAKARLNAAFGLKPDNSEVFWIVLGFDQYLHMLTYIAIVWVLS